jgi:hypothetical protein
MWLEAFSQYAAKTAQKAMIRRGILLQTEGGLRGRACGAKGCHLLPPVTFAFRRVNIYKALFFFFFASSIFTSRRCCVASSSTPMGYAQSNRAQSFPLACFCPV